MENYNCPMTSRERAGKIRDCAEICREQGMILTAARLAYLANWTPQFASWSVQWYAGLLNDARRDLA
jgi:hypothetical protein